MESQHPKRVQELTRREALELLQLHSYVGRIGFVVDGRPLILPVNYLADDASIVFCTEPGTKGSPAAGKTLASPEASKAATEISCTRMWSGCG